MSNRFTTALGPIPQEWEAKTVGELAIHVGSGITPTGGSDVYTDSGVTFIRSQNVTNDGLLLDDVAFIDKRTHDRMKGSEVVPFDVLLNITGASIGRCCFLPSGLGPTNVNQHVCAIRLPTPSRADAKYLSSVLASPIGQNQIFRLNAGGNREGLNYQQLKMFRVPWPSKQCRAGIARILATVDHLIEKTESLIAKYQAIKQGMMHDLFTRGVDAHGHVRPPQAEAPDLYKQSELGWIPKEWDCVSCTEVCREIVVGIVVQPAQYYQSDGVSVLRSANVRESGIDGNDMVFMSDESNRLLAKSMLRTGDVVTVRTGYPGTSCVVSPEYDGSNCVDIIISRPGTRIRSQFLATWINSDSGKNQVLRKQGGLAQQHFNVGELKDLLVVLPSVEEQAKIESVLLTHKSDVRTEEIHRHKLHLLKTGLMQDLLTGKVRVKVDEAEEVVV